METKTHLDEAVSGFREARQLTYDLLTSLNDQQLVKTLPRPDLDTFGKHFQELGDTQESYALGIHSGVMDFSTIRTYIAADLVSSQERLLSFLQGHDDRLQEILSATISDAVVVWPGGEQISVVEHLGRLTRHEVFHHGQLAAFVYLRHLRFPKSWIDTWVLPSHSGELYSLETSGRSH
jgi:hypothetical protein